jgi:hypothetical protein
VLGKSADAAVKSGLAPAWLNSMKQGFELAHEVLGGTIDFSLYNQKFNAWVDAAGLLKAKEINETTRQALLETLRGEISEGVQAGESMPKIAARIRDAADGIYDNIAEPPNHRANGDNVSVNMAVRGLQGEGVTKRMACTRRQTRMHIWAPQIED